MQEEEPIEKICKKKSDIENIPDFLHLYFILITLPSPQKMPQKVFYKYRFEDVLL